ncbi:gamma-secretase subunit PEN [Acrasis kona]|uniref:Gamma-secretase subunit PEN n=1 Tax=Acrasis kona TaxID=1008807 RepID=A0AAW2ZKJ3_9EUKA
MDPNQYPQQYPQPSQPYPPQQYPPQQYPPQQVQYQPYPPQPVHNPFVVQENSPQQGSPQYAQTATTTHTVIVQVDGDQVRIKRDTDYATILLILGFFLNWLWLINFILYRRSISEVARKYAKYSLIAFFVFILISAITSAIIIIANVIAVSARR